MEDLKEIARQAILEGLVQDNILDESFSKFTLR